MKHKSQQGGMTSTQNSFCVKVTEELSKLPISILFLRPVDPIRDNCPDYLDRIKSPMDLGTVMRKLKNHQYSTPERWKEDVNLIWHNAKLYNGPDNFISTIAQELEEYFAEKTSFIPKKETEDWLLSINAIMKKLVLLADSRPSNQIKPSLKLRGPSARKM